MENVSKKRVGERLFGELGGLTESATGLSTEKR